MSTPKLRAELDGLPTYKPGRPPVAAEGEPAFKLSSNENPYPPLPGVLEAAMAAAAQFNRYPDLTCAELTAELAERFGVPVEHIATGTGSVGVAQQLVQSTAGAGDEVVYAWRSFEAYPIITRVSGARAVEVPLDAAETHDLDAMAAAITERTRLIFVCNPNNPTGGMLARREIEELLDAVPATVLVVLDEAYAEYVESADYPDGSALAEERPNVAVLRTFSKLFGLAGLRIGYLIGPAPVVLAVRRLRHWYEVSDAAHLAALACLGDPAEVARRVEQTRGARERLVAILAGHGLTALPSVTSFVAAPVADALALAEQLARRGVLVRPVPQPSGDLLRIGVGDDVDLALLDSALADVAVSE
jgi:histidinol-phosphate aminotransferase